MQFYFFAIFCYTIFCALGPGIRNFRYEPRKKVYLDRIANSERWTKAVAIANKKPFIP